MSQKYWRVKRNTTTESMCAERLATEDTTRESRLQLAKQHLKARSVSQVILVVQGHSFIGFAFKNAEKTRAVELGKTLVVASDTVNGLPWLKPNGKYSDGKKLRSQMSKLGIAYTDGIMQHLGMDVFGMSGGRFVMRSIGILVPNAKAASSTGRFAISAPDDFKGHADLTRLSDVEFESEYL